MLCGFHGNFVKMISRGKNELFFYNFCTLVCDMDVVYMDLHLSTLVWECQWGKSILWSTQCDTFRRPCHNQKWKKKKKVFWLWGENTKVSRRRYKSQPHRIVKIKEFIRKNRRRRKCIFSGNTVDKNLTSDDE